MNRRQLLGPLLKIKKNLALCRKLRNVISFPESLNETSIIDKPVGKKYKCAYGDEEAGSDNEVSIKQVVMSAAVLDDIAV